MKINFLNTNFKKRGFILPITMVICTIMLTISTGISYFLIKELYFSRVSRDSQLAYYAADAALMCAISTDDLYTDSSTGLGIFPYDNVTTPQSVLDQTNAYRESRNLSTLSLSDIKCATSSIFDPEDASYSSVPFNRTNSLGQVETGQRSSFLMRMDLGNNTYRCAAVIVYKTQTYRQIIARGFSSCADTYAQPIERAIVNTTEIE